MRTTFLGLSAVLMASVSAPALADEAPADAFTMSGSVALVSDYRFRGYSQNNKSFAVQGSATIAHESGLYATIWGSSIDEGVATGSDQEIGLIAGYKTTLGAVTIDGGVLYYFYPGSNKNAGSIALTCNTGGVGPLAGVYCGKNHSDFFEPYLSVSGAIGPVTAKVTANYAPSQGGLGYFPYVPVPVNVYSPVKKLKADSLYTALDLSGSIPDTPISLSAHLGHYWTKSLVSGQKKYTDWSVGASYTWKKLTLGVSYVDTNIKTLWNPTANVYGLTGYKQLGKSGVVGSLTFAF